MTLAAILGFYLLSLGSSGLGWMPSHAGAFAVHSPVQQPPAGGSSDASASQPQAPQSQTTEPVQPAPSPNQPPNSPARAKPRHHKKTAPCSNAPTALNPAPGNPADSANPVAAGSAGAGSTNTGSTNPASIETGSAKDAPANKGSAPLKPCPPPKKVVRNGGSNEPSIQLLGGTPSEQTLQASTEQLTAATEENLKKIAGRPLNPSQQEMVTQIKQFMEQSKTAIAAGDVQRGHNLATKARLLSDELIKP